MDKVIYDFKPDIIIGTWLNPFGVYAKYIKEKENVTYYALAEGSDILIHPNKYSGRDYVSSIVDKYCDKLIVVSEDMYYKVNKSKYANKIKLIKNGFDGDIFSFVSDKSKKNNGKIRLITVANFNFEKGHDIIIKAMKLLGPDYELSLIGEGPLLDKCKHETNANGLTKRIKFLGRVEHKNLKEYLKNQDIFCMPSRSEGLPAAPLEAMATGLPVVATNVGGLPQIIENGFNGFLCNPESPNDLAEKIKLAANKGWDRKKISEWAIVNYGWDKWADEIINIYEKG